jgi:hypothetical protein
LRYPRSSLVEPSTLAIVTRKTLAVLLPGLDGSGELFAEFVAASPERLDTLVVELPHSTS